jgi:hypothetical protein
MNRTENTSALNLKNSVVLKYFVAAGYHEPLGFKMKNVFLNLKSWCRGKYNSPSIAQVLDEEEIGEEFTKPIPVKIAISFWRYIKNEYKWIIGVILIAAGLYLTYQQLLVLIKQT